MDYPFILLWVFGWCALRTVGFLFQAEQNADARQNQQHTDTAEQQRTETAGDRQRKALAVDALISGEASLSLNAEPLVLNVRLTNLPFTYESVFVQFSA